MTKKAIGKRSDFSQQLPFKKFLLNFIFSRKTTKRKNIGKKTDAFSQGTTKKIYIRWRRKKNKPKMCVSFSVLLFLEPESLWERKRAKWKLLK